MIRFFSCRHVSLLVSKGFPLRFPCVLPFSFLSVSFLFVANCPSSISYAVGFHLSKTALFDWTFFNWILLVLVLIVSRVYFIVFVLFLEAVGVRKYCCTVQAKSVGSSVLPAVSACNGSTNLRPSELVALVVAESRQSYGRGLALSRESPHLQQAQPLLAARDRGCGLLPSCDTRRWRAELGMCHADLLREGTAGIAKPASAPSMILQCGTWYGCVAVWPCGCVFGDGMGDAIGSKNTCKTFSTEFFD